MSYFDDNPILEHLAYIGTAIEEMGQDVKDILAMFYRIECSVQHILSSER
jgi:hypothetical protein